MSRRANEVARERHAPGAGAERAAQSTVTSLFEMAARLGPQRLALDDGARQLSYAALAERVCRLAGVLGAHDIGRGSRIATGAIAAVLGDCGVRAEIMREFAIITRCAGPVEHVPEKQRKTAMRAIREAADTAVPFEAEATGKSAVVADPPGSQATLPRPWRPCHKCRTPRRSARRARP